MLFFRYHILGFPQPYVFNHTRRIFFGRGGAHLVRQTRHSQCVFMFIIVWIHESVEINNNLKTKVQDLSKININNKSLKKY